MKRAPDKNRYIHMEFINLHYLPDQPVDELLQNSGYKFHLSTGLAF